MAKKKKGVKRVRGRGRPPTRGPTIQVVLRMSRDLHEKVEAYRRAADVLATKTAIVERLMRDGLKRDKAEALKKKPTRT